MLMLPLSRLGVPTQISDTSVARIASSTSSSAVSRPACLPACIKSLSRGSTTGGSPSRKHCRLVALTSRPMTWCPAAEKQAADTAPT